MLTPVVCGSCSTTAEVDLLTTAACGNCGSDDLDFFEGSVKEAAVTPYGEVRVWADGYGNWHASVALDDHSINAAQNPVVAEAALEAIRNELHERSSGRTSGGPAAYDPSTTGVKFERADHSPDGQYLAYFVETNIHDAALNGHQVAFFASRVEGELGEPERNTCPNCGTANYYPNASYCPMCGHKGLDYEKKQKADYENRVEINRCSSVPDPRTDEWDGTAPMEPFPEPTTFGSLHVEADEDIATTIRGVLKKDDEFGYAVPADLVDALDDGEVKAAWMKLMHGDMPPSYNDMSMGPQHASRNWARAIVTNILIDRHGRKGYGSQHEAAYPPEGSKVRHASPQAWRRLREQMQEVELRDIARDIASVAGGDSRKIADALINKDWFEGYHQGSLHEAAVKRHHYNDLVNRPTQSQGQADDLKLDDGEHRWWVARSSKEDGEPFEHTIHVEKHNPDTGGWEDHISYDGDHPESAPIHHLGAAQCQYPGCANQPRSNSTYCPQHDVWAQHLRDVNSKLKEIASGVLATNPGMQHEAAMAIAEETLKRFPRMATAPPPEEVEDMPHTLQRMVQDFQRTHPRQPVDV